MSRWGIGHDFAVSETPGVSIQSGTVTWTELDGADRYEIQINEVAEDGSYVREKVVAVDDLTTHEFALPQDLQNRRLAVWVRAISDTDDGPDKTAWSRVAMTHDVVHADPVNFRVWSRFGDSLELTLPVPTFSLAPSPSKKFEVYVALASDSDQFIRAEVSDFRYICNPDFSSHQSEQIGRVTLPSEFQQKDVIVWVREIGNGLRKSRWGDGQLMKQEDAITRICIVNGGPLPTEVVDPF